MSTERPRVAILCAGTLRTYVPLERAVAFAAEFSRHVPVRLVVPDEADNRPLAGRIGAARLAPVRRGRLEPLAKFWWIVRHRPQVVYCVGGWLRNVLPAFLARALVGGKLVVDFDEVLSLWPGRRQGVFAWLERHVLTRADVLVCVSHGMQRWAEGLGMAPGRVLRVPYAADTSMMARLAGTAGDAPHSGPVRLAYLGSLLTHYDFWLLLDVLAAAREAGVDAVLELVGDGPGRAEFLRRVAERGLEPHVRLHGYHEWDTAAPLLAGCDALLFPIRDTPNNRMRCPQKSYVYLAIGTPVVTCAVGEVAVAHEGWSQLVPIDDLPAWVAAIRCAREEPPARRADRRAHAVRAHDWPVRAREAWQQLTGVLQELTHGD